MEKEQEQGHQRYTGDQKGPVQMHIATEVLHDLIELPRKRRLRTKVLYSVSVFTGTVLIWSGLWSIVSTIPVLRIPVVSLLVTGYFFHR
ncbi:MAG: hypothetical protein K9L28_00115 [Synergistales bacterium]|nr:hypothetical protein [Synergistales bacterium]